MITTKTSEEIEKMRSPCRTAGLVRETLADMLRPGITTASLDEEAEALISSLGVRSAFKGYHGYPGSVCISVNEEVVHGLPGSRRIDMGDIVSLDVGILENGFYGDTAVTVMVGVSDLNIMRLVETTRLALYAGIAHARAGQRLSDISNAIEQTASSAGFSVVRDFVGHGIGRQLHEDPQIPNYGPPGRGPMLAEGMTLAIEPMLNMGLAAVKVLQDGWTVVTRDSLPSAHFEHTVLVGRLDAQVLTDFSC